MVEKVVLSMFFVRSGMKLPFRSSRSLDYKAHSGRFVVIALSEMSSIAVHFSRSLDN
jgi:hypothetical protein